MREGIPTNTAASCPIAASISQFIGARSFRGNNYRSDVINGMLKLIERSVDLCGVKIDNAQGVCREVEFSPAREFDQSRQLAREMIRHTNDFRFFVDQFRVGQD